MDQQYEGNALDEFRAAMEAAGLSTRDEIIDDGKLHRFHVDGDSRGKENGWYVLHVDDRPAGQFGSWKTGQSETWIAKQERRLTDRERRELERRMSEQRKQREAEEARVQNEAASRALTIWNECLSNHPGIEKHPYIIRKAINPHGVRLSLSALVIPLRDATGKLWSLQFIQENGEKRYLSGGRKHGCYFTIGRPSSETAPIAICEGFSTGASIHAATDLAVAVAFDAGNLTPVALALRKKYPDALLVICADNDQWTKGNPGITKGKEAADAVGGVLVYPEFKI